MTHLNKVWKDDPDHTTPISAAALVDLESRISLEIADQIAALGGEVLPSGGDDTSLINAAITAGQPLGVGTFQVAGIIDGCPRGQGAARTILHATSASARIQHGNALGGAQISAAGTFGGFAFDGAGVTGVSTPMFTSNVVTATYIDMAIYNTASAGTAGAVYGQNCLFQNCVFGVSSVGLVLDQGCGGNVFNRCEVANCKTYNVSIQQSIPVYTGSAYSVPTLNTFNGCIFEGGNSGHIANLHISNADANTFSECQFSGDTTNTVANVLVDQSGLPSGFPNFNANTYLRNCSYTATPTGAPAIKAAANAIYGVYPVILQGDQIFGQGVSDPAIKWEATTGQIRQDGTAQGYTILYTSGSGTAQLAYAPYSLAAIRLGDTFEPKDIGLLLASADPALTNGAQALNTGYIYLVKLNVPQNLTVSKVLLWLTAAGSGLTTGNLVGIYDSQGHLRAKTGDMTAAWAAAGLSAPSLTAQPGYSLTLEGGDGVFYWVAILSNGTTSPSFASTGVGSGMPPNLGYGYPYAQTVPGAVHRYAYPGSGYTTLPSLNGVTLTDAFLTAGIPWVGVA